MAIDYDNQQDTYISFIQYKLINMKEILPENTRFIKILKCMSSAWRKHIDQNIDIQQAMHMAKDEYINFENDIQF